MQVEQRRAKGATVKGHKIGLTAAAMQRSLGVTEPDYGHLFDDMFYDEFTPISVDRLLQPRIEPEIAFVLGKHVYRDLRLRRRKQSMPSGSCCLRSS